MNYYDKKMQEEQERLEREIKEIHYESPAYFLWFSVMKGCGCGSNDELMEDVWNLFEGIILKKEDSHKVIYSDNYHELIAHMLDARFLTEHGTSIGGSWGSKLGEWLYKTLKEKPNS